MSKQSLPEVEESFLMFGREWKVSKEKGFSVVIHGKEWIMPKEPFKDIMIMDLYFFSCAMFNMLFVWILDYFVPGFALTEVFGLEYVLLLFLFGFVMCFANFISSSFNPLFHITLHLVSYFVISLFLITYSSTLAIVVTLIAFVLFQIFQRNMAIFVKSTYLQFLFLRHLVKVEEDETNK